MSRTFSAFFAIVLLSAAAHAQTIIGRVNGHPIYKQELEERSSALVLQGHTPIEAQRDAWHQLVEQRLIEESADQLGIRVTAKETLDSIVSNPPDDIRQQFSDSAGMYHSWDVRQAFTDPRNDSLSHIMIEQYRKNLRLQKWQHAMLNFVLVTDSEVLQRAYDDSSHATIELLQMPLGRGMSESFEFEISDSQSLAYYNDHRYRFDGPERRWFRFVWIDSVDGPVEARSQSFLRLASKVGFDSAARKMNLKIISDAPSVVKTDPVPIFGSYTIRNWMMTAKVGQLSRPFVLPAQQRGRIVVRLDSIRAAGIRPFDDVHSEIKKILARRRALEALATRLNEVERTLPTKAPLQAIARATHDPNTRVKELSVTPVSALPGLGVTEYTINNAAFSEPVGSSSEILRGEAGVYILRVVERTVAHHSIDELRTLPLREQIKSEKASRFLKQWIDRKIASASIEDYSGLH